MESLLIQSQILLAMGFSTGGNVDFIEVALQLLRANFYKW